MTYEHTAQRGHARHHFPFGRGFLLLLLTAAWEGGCGRTLQAESRLEVPAGNLSISGSTTVFPLAAHAIKPFMARHPQVKVDLRQNSTGEGLKEFLEGKITIANATRPPKKAEYDTAKAKGMELHLTSISNDAVVIVVHPDTALVNLTIAQLKGVFFTGAIKDWSELTGGVKSGPIHVYTTDPKISGTAELFAGKVAGSADTPYASGSKAIHPTPEMIPTVGADSMAIGYSPLKWIDKRVKVIPVESVTATEGTILRGEYPLTRRMYMITNGSPKGIERVFLTFLLSKAGQEMAHSEGFIPVVGGGV